MKLCVSSSGCKSRPTKGEPAQVSSEPCDSPRNRAARFLGAPPSTGPNVSCVARWCYHWSSLEMLGVECFASHNF